MTLSPEQFLAPRVEFIKDYPDAPFIVGDVLSCYEHNGKIYLHEQAKLEPDLFPFNFRKLRWHDHRTLEQLLSIKYMKVVGGGSYYGVGDIVKVIEMRYNDNSIVGGRNCILFSLKGHYFNISELQPATKEEHDIFWNNNNAKGRVE